MFITPQTIGGQAAVNPAGGWGHRDVAEAVGRDGHVHREVPRLDDSHAV